MPRWLKVIALLLLCLAAIINLGLVIQFNDRRVLPFGDPENPAPVIGGIFVSMVLCAFGAFFLFIHLVRTWKKSPHPGAWTTRRRK